jgi:leader peptidase (prepilin peptidase)/N-methyltransferase
MVKDLSALKLFLYVYMFALGAVVGSFLNVVIARLPEGKSLVWPSSHCPKCDAPIRWFDNIPLVSFIILRRKCRSCGESISWRYPAVELLTAVLFFLLLSRFTNILALAVYMLFTCSLVVITFIDLKHYIIPDEISIPGIFIGLALSLLPAHFAGHQLVISSAPHFLTNLLSGLLAKGSMLHTLSSSFLNSLIGCIVGGGMLYLAAGYSRLVLKKEGMGGGDIKLLGMVGAFLGLKLALMTIVVGSVVGAAVGITLILLRLKTRDDYIPFGPYLALGAMLSVLYGNQLWDRYFAFGVWLNQLTLGKY